MSVECETASQLSRAVVPQLTRCGSRRFLYFALTALLLLLLYIYRSIRTGAEASRRQAKSRSPGVKRGHHHNYHRGQVARSTSRGSGDKGETTSPSVGEAVGEPAEVAAGDETSVASGDSKHHKSHSNRPKLNKALPTVMLLIGIHASGKSEWARQYVERVHKSYVLISSDDTRAAITGSPTDYSREDEVEKALLEEVAKQIEKRRSCIVDDCVHNLQADFRAHLQRLVPTGTYNTIAKLFPIKVLFARTRIDKDINDGMSRFNPSPEQLELLYRRYGETEGLLKQEGWLVGDWK